MDHNERIRSIETSFTTAVNDLVAAVQRIDQRAATTRPPDGGWTVAQIAEHVAITNEWMALTLSDPDNAMLVDKPPAFEERLKNIQFPAKVKTFPVLEPSADASPQAALSRLRASAEKLAGAVAALPVQRADMQCVKLPFATISLYEFGEFAAAHTARHTAQVQRTVAAV